MTDGSGPPDAKRPGTSGGGRARPDPERITEVVLALPDVVSMSAGPLGQFRSYLPGGNTVVGVRVDPDHLDVNVVTRYGPNLAVMGSLIRHALEPIAAGRSITVGIDDVLVAGDSKIGAQAGDAADSMTESPPESTPGSGRVSVPSEVEH